MRVPEVIWLVAIEMEEVEAEVRRPSASTVKMTESETDPYVPAETAVEANSLAAITSVEMLRTPVEEIVASPESD